MRLLSLVLISFFVSFHASGQENTWKTLAKISIEKRFDEILNYDIEYPIFSEAVKKLDGTKKS
uniref:hypothetical protein n=1 Tax=Roseivirga sp. TaxID=1964215 RepID=UPI004047E809